MANVGRASCLLFAFSLVLGRTEAYAFQAASVLTPSVLHSSKSVSSLRLAAGFTPKLGPQRPMGLRGGLRTAAMASPSLSAIKTQKLTPLTAGWTPFYALKCKEWKIQRMIAIYAQSSY